MKKSELRQIIREERDKLHEAKYTIEIDKSAMEILKILKKDWGESSDVYSDVYDCIVAYGDSNKLGVHLIEVLQNYDMNGESVYRKALGIKKRDSEKQLNKKIFKID